MRSPRSASDTSVALAIPADPGLVRFVRLVAVSLARVHGIADEHLDDVRLATSEACARAVAAHRGADIGARVQVEITGGKALTVSVRDLVPLPVATGLAAAELLREEALRQHGRDLPSAPVDDVDPMPEAVGLLAGLADDVTVETGPDGTSVRMSWSPLRRR
ncbi:MAG: ATP-binding protein [Nocardioidaceae bacterium]